MPEPIEPLQEQTNITPDQTVPIPDLPTTTPEQPNIWEKFLERANKYGALIGLIGILLAIAAIATPYFFPEKYREISVQHIDTPVKIYDNTSSVPSIKVLDAKGQRVNGDIYATEVTVWNSGKEEIDPHDARKPLTISLFPCDRILDYKIVKQVRPDVANFRVSELPSSAGTATLQVGWDYFDPGFAVKVQIIYQGNDKTTPHLNGYIVDARPFVDANRPTSERLLGQPILGTISYLVLWFVVPGVIGLPLLDYIVKRRLGCWGYLLLFSVFMPYMLWFVNFTANYGKAPI